METFDSQTAVAGYDAQDGGEHGPQGLVAPLTREVEDTLKEGKVLRAQAKCAAVMHVVEVPASPEDALEKKMASQGRRALRT